MEPLEEGLSALSGALYRGLYAGEREHDLNVSWHFWAGFDLSVLFNISLLSSFLAFLSR